MEDCYCGAALSCDRGKGQRCTGPGQTYTAVFIGGPLGGTTQAIQTPDSRIYVPVLDRSRLTTFVAGGALPPMPWHDDFAPYEKEEYRREYISSNSNRCSVTYRWINPAESLREANAKLREENRVLGEQAEKLAIIKEALT